jgi:hypothetical protein
MLSATLRHEGLGTCPPATQASSPGVPALEVRASYRGVLIGTRLLADPPPVRHLRLLEDHARDNRYTIGASSSSDAPAAMELLGSTELPLVARWGAGFLVNVTPGMTGDVAVAGRVFRLADYLAGRGTNFTLPPDGSARIQCGDMSFQLAHTTTPAPLPRRWLGWRWAEQKFTLGSIVALGLFLLMIFAIPPEGATLTTSFAGMTPAYVPFDINAHEQPELPEFLTKPTEQSTNQGNAGKPHPGAPGKMGDKTSKKPSGQFAIKGDGTDMHLGKDAAAARIRDSGLIGVLNRAGSPFASILGRDSAAGDAKDDIMGQLLAANLDNCWGPGGLGPSGTGAGGGGQGLPTLGIGQYNTVGGGYARDRGIPGGLGRKPEHKLGGVIPGQVTTKGFLDREIVRRVVRLHMNEVKYCYEQQLVTKPGLGGRISLQFVISGTGQVISSFVQSTTMNDARVERCVVEAVKRWTFPRPNQAGIAIVSYPFNFVGG